LHKFLQAKKAIVKAIIFIKNLHMKIVVAATALLLATQICVAQNKQATSAQATDKVQKTPVVIDNALFSELQALDTKEPYEYFSKASLLYEDNQKDKAALVFQIGLLRYQYFLSQNPNYAPNNNWMVTESMKSAYQGKINQYLQANSSNHIAILKLAVSYYAANDYAKCSKQKNSQKYEQVISGYNKTIADLEGRNVH